MYERARAFRREFGYDFIQWGSPRDDDHYGCGFLFNDDIGVFGHGANRRGLRIPLAQMAGSSAELWPGVDMGRAGRETPGHSDPALADVPQEVRRFRDQTSDQRRHEGFCEEASGITRLLTH